MSDGLPFRETQAPPRPQPLSPEGRGVSRSPLPLHRDHRRDFGGNRYVYPVVSRRSRGVSVGLNLNPDKVCNFDCVYCQVDRTTPGFDGGVDLNVLARELDDMLTLLRSGALFEDER